MSNKKSKGRAELEETTQTQRGQNRGQRKPKVQPGEKKQTDEKIVQSDPRNGRRATNRFITERKRAGDALQHSEEHFRILFDEALDGICLADAETGFIIDCNQALAALVGRERAELIGQPQKTLHPSQNDKAAHSPTFRQHLNDKEGQTLETQVVTSTGIIRDVEIKANRLNFQGREMLQGIFHDITERKRAENQIKASLAEKEVLLREIHHRVKNNMQIVSSILNLQAGSVKDPAALECLRGSQSRIRSMALVHEKLYRSSDFSRIDFGEYVRSLVTALFQSCRTDSNQVRLDFKAEAVFLDINTAIPCGLVTNELIVNALKYAFPEGRSGVVKIRLRPLGKDEYRLVISDNGVGFPKDLDFRNTESLGMQLVTLLVGQLDGTINLKRKGGTTFDIVFKEQKKKK